jgi:hypothetical protein
MSAALLELIENVRSTIFCINHVGFGTEIPVFVADKVKQLLLNDIFVV